MDVRQDSGIDISLREAHDGRARIARQCQEAAARQTGDRVIDRRCWLQIIVLQFIVTNHQRTTFTDRPSGIVNECWRSGITCYVDKRSGNCTVTNTVVGDNGNNASR